MKNWLGNNRLPNSGRAPKFLSNSLKKSSFKKPLLKPLKFPLIDVFSEYFFEFPPSFGLYLGILYSFSYVLFPSFVVSLQIIYPSSSGSDLQLLLVEYDLKYDLV